MSPEGTGARAAWRPEHPADRALCGAFSLAFAVSWLPFQLTRSLPGAWKAEWLVLDLLSLPGTVLRVTGRLFGARGTGWGLKTNALEHLYLVCRLCPAERQALRDPRGTGICAWRWRWTHGEFDIPPHFGHANWRSQYRGHTDLAAYRDLAVPEDG